MDGRCWSCSKRKPILYSCKCGGSYCIKHLGSEAHGCQYNHFEGQRRALTARLEPIRAEKVPPV